MVTSEGFHAKGLAPVQQHLKAFRGKPVYVTLDIDCVDPAYAPGTGTPQVGGFTSAQIIELVRALNGLQIIGADLVEVSPPFDNGDITHCLRPISFSSCSAFSRCRPSRASSNYTTISRWLSAP